MRLLYLARHGDAENGHLSARGRRQAELLAARLADVPLSTVTHSPLPRAAETAAALPVPAVASEIVGDYPPYLPAHTPATFTPLVEGWTPDELRDGPKFAQEALSRFAVPAPEETHELVVTHSFLVAWFVRAALGAPEDRWMGLNNCNAALTVIRYTDERPPALMLFNDMSHLPADLRWTGFPPHLRL